MSGVKFSKEHEWIKLEGEQWESPNMQQRCWVILFL